MTRLLTLLVILILSSPALSSDWPEFRGPTGQGISSSTNLPTHWSPTTNIAWKTPTPPGWSSPVISNGKIYLTAGIESPPSLRALCLDASTGKTLWNVEVFAPKPGDTGALHKKNSLASPTPIVTADRLYVHFGHLGAAALDLSGKVLWRQTSFKYSSVHGNGGSPVLLDNLLIFNADAAQNPQIIALDSATGQIKWKSSRSLKAKLPFAFCTPLLIDVNGQQQLISPASGMVGAYDPKTGREIWRVRYPEGYSIVPRPVFAHGLVFISSSFDNPILYAINPAGAKGDVTNSHVKWTSKKAAPMTPSPLAVGDELYTVSDNGIASCYDARTGKTHWTERLGGNYSASPIAAEGRIYFQSEEGPTFVIKAGKTYELIAENDLAERTFASPATIDHAIVLRTERHLYRISSTPLSTAE